MAKKTEKTDPTPERAQIDDHQIVAKIILRKNEFRAAAVAESKKTFELPKEATAIHLSERAHALYQEWAKATDESHVGVSKKPVDGEKGATAHYEAGDTRLHEFFAGLPIVVDVDLPGESVVIV